MAELVVKTGGGEKWRLLKTTLQQKAKLVLNRAPARLGVKRVSVRHCLVMSNVCLLHLKRTLPLVSHPACCMETFENNTSAKSKAGVEQSTCQTWREKSERETLINKGPQNNVFFWEGWVFL